MKVVLRNVVFLLGFVAYNYFCFANDNIRIGAFFDNDEPSETANWDVIKDHMPEGTEFIEPETNIIPGDDVFESSKIFCEATSKSKFFAIFGPKSLRNSETIGSICSFFKIPYIVTHWIPSNFGEIPSTTFSLYPDANLFSLGLATIVQSLDWKKFVVIYEDEESLAKLQDVLKYQEHKEGYDKNDVLIKRLGSGPDYRSLLKDVAGSGIRKIVLDCHTDKILDILKQAREVKLLADISTSFFVTSLDAHTLDFSELKIGANITTIRLFDPNNETFQKIVNQYYPTVAPEKIRIETALQHDAMLLLAESINSLLTNNLDMELTTEPKFCNSTKTYEDKLELINHMKQVIVPNGLTGKIDLENSRREKFIIEVIEIEKLDKPIGIWDSEEPESIQLTRNATEREAELQRRLMSHNFIVSSKIGKPYLMETLEPGAVGNARYKGYSKDLITEIAKLMNITFHIVLTYKDQQTSIVDDLVNRRADLGICDFTITHQRRELIDFSMPFMSLGISILHKKPEEEIVKNMYAFMDPFSWKVWIYIVTLYLILSLVILIIARLDPDDWENPHPCNQEPEELENIWGFKNCLWLTMGSIMTQGCDILPKGISSRIATAMWWFFSLIMTSSYTANMAAFLTMQKGGETIDNVEELANQNKVKYGSMKGGSTQDFFKYSNDSLYQKMWAVMKNENPSVFEDSNDGGVERVSSTKNALYAFFMESTQIEYVLERKCELRKIGQWLDSKSYGIGMPFGADYRHAINSAVLRLQENGKLNELKEKWWKKDLEGEPCPSNSDEVNQDELTLAHVGGVFVVLGAGLGLAFFFAILEFLWNIHNISLEEHMTYMEALKCELKFACNIWVTRKQAKPMISESSSSKSDDNKSTARTILAGAGSFLNINASVLNRMGQNGR